MFESIETYTNELESNIELTRQFIQKLQGGTRRLSNSIEKAEEAVKVARNETKYASDVKKALNKEILSNVKALLMGKALEAIRINYEFDSPPYRNALFTAIRDDDTYIIRSKGSGFKSIVSVDIDLNRTAGRLNMWGSAVKAARRALGVKVSRKKDEKKRLESAIKASRAWAGIFERRAGVNSKFNRTIRLRLQYSAKPAPFWSIINFGKPETMTSDRGGYPTPKNKSTNFVKETEDSINVFISNLLSKEKDKYDNLMSNYQTALDQAKANLAELDSLVSEIRLDFKQLQSLGRRADKILKANYITKLEKAVQLIREGLLSAKGVQLATKGSYRGKRLSMETMAGILQ